MLLDGICDIINVLFQTVFFGALSADKNNAVWYYILIFISGPYTMQYETIIDENIILSGDIFLNSTDLT